MKTRYFLFVLGLVTFAFIYSCSKDEMFKSEKEIKNELQGTWDLVPIPRYDVVNGDSNIHIENWKFDDTNVTIVNSSQIGTSTYSVNTTISKAEFKLDGVTPDFYYPARVRSINGTWQIIRLDDEFLIIANDQDGSTGLTELEFQKRN